MQLAADLTDVSNPKTKTGNISSYNTVYLWVKLALNEWKWNISKYKTIIIIFGPLAQSRRCEY